MGGEQGDEVCLCSGYECVCDGLRPTVAECLSQVCIEVLELAACVCCDLLYLVQLRSYDFFLCWHIARRQRFALCPQMEIDSIKPLK